MTAQRRGPLLRIAVVGALVSGAVLLPAAPALADVRAAPGAMELNPGESREITITLTGNDAENTPDETRITVPNALSGEVSLTGCGENGRSVVTCDSAAYQGNDQQRQLKVTIAAKNPSGLQPNQNREGTITVQVGGEQKQVDVRVKGPAQAASVTEVSGKVVNQSTAEAVPNAQVTLKDSAGTEHNATANGKGEFRITPQNNKTIAPGALTLTATFEGFSDGTANANGTAGKATSGVQIRMKPAAASVPPSAPAGAEPSDEPSSDASDLATPSNTSGESEGPSMLSWLLIGVGVVLVLLGIGAIVLLLMRRKGDDDGSDDDYGQRPNQMAPVGAGAYRGGDRTMVAGSPGMNDATAIVGPQQQLDEFPDPYAAPPPARAGYGSGYDQATSVAPAPGYGRGGYDDGNEYSRGEPGYGNNGNGGYGQGGGYGGGAGAGYGAGQGGPGGQGGQGARYADEPTGHYAQPVSGGYGGGQGQGGPAGPANGYGGQGANGYGGGQGGPANGYGGGQGPANGYGGQGGQANGYGGGQAGGANGYGGGQGGPANGYGGGQGGGGDYGRSGGGYPSAGGYEQPPAGGGYDRADQGGDPRNRGRSVDWLD